MKYYLKRNIHHPVIEVDGETLVWERYGFAQGLLKTENEKVIAVLDKVAAESKSVRELTEAEYKDATAAQKKTTETPVRRSFPIREATVDNARSGKSAKKSEPPSPASPTPVAAPAGKKASNRPIISTPIIQAPPGITGSLDEPELP